MTDRFRSTLTAASLAAVLAVSVLPARAQSNQVSADYAVSFLGLPIGRGTMVSTGDGRTYRTTLEAEVTGIAALFAGGTGTAVATGRLTPSAAIPSSFSIETRSGSKVETTRITLTGGNVTAIARNPDKPPHPRATPVLPEHLQGVLDPLSAGIFLAGGSGPVTGAAACDRRAPIFGGRERFDLIFSFVETRQVEIGGYKGEAAVCRVRFEPIAGYRPDRNDIQSARRRSAEVILVPVRGTRTLIPARISLSTGYGIGVAEATRLALDGAPQGRRASAD